jgi:HAMP domain-containing protein
MEIIRAYSIWILAFANICLLVYAFRSVRE